VNLIEAGDKAGRGMPDAGSFPVNILPAA